MWTILQRLIGGDFFCVPALRPTIAAFATAAVVSIAVVVVVAIAATAFE